MWIPINRDWTVKPPLGTPLRTDGHWSVQGLVGCWLFNEGAQQTIKNMVNGKLSTHTRIASDVGFCSGLMGMQFQSGADSGGAGFSESAPPTTLTQCTIISVMYPDTTYGSYEDAFGGTQAGGTLLTTKAIGSSSPVATLCYFGGYGYVFCADGPGLAVGASSGIDAFMLGKPTIVAGAYDNINGFKIYINGKLSGNNNFNYVGTFGGTFNSLGISIANNPDWTASAHEFFAFMSIYNRALSPNEIASLSANPYQVCQP